MEMLLSGPRITRMFGMGRIEALLFGDSAVSLRMGRMLEYLCDTLFAIGH